MAMRNVLRKQGKKKFNPGTAASMLFLNATNPRHDQDRCAPLMIEWGYSAQRLAYRTAKMLRPGAAPDAAAAGDRRAAQLQEQVVHFINKPMPGKPAQATARALLEHRRPRLSCRSSAIRPK